jgi:hypothetical protein
VLLGQALYLGQKVGTFLKARHDPPSRCALHTCHLFLPCA